jgi:hypothetical protein
MTMLPVATDPASPPASAPNGLARWARRAALATVAALALGTAAMGFLHTRAGRPLLMKLAGIGGCPLGKASAADVDRVRAAALATDKGARPAPSRPALGFELERTQIADVRAWRDRAGASCTELRDATLVICRDVAEDRAFPRGAGRASRGVLSEVSFGFSLDGRLTSIATLYSGRSGEDASRMGEATQAALVTALGEPHARAGSFAERGSVATISYRFSDYAADVTASQVSGSRHVLRESFMSVR